MQMNNFIVSTISSTCVHRIYSLFPRRYNNELIVAAIVRCFGQIINELTLALLNEELGRLHSG